MKCCEDKETKNELMDGEHQNDEHSHSPMKHIKHMVLCMGIPLLILISLPFIARYNPVLATRLGFLAPLICPLMMVGMAIPWFLGRKKKDNSCH